MTEYEPHQNFSRILVGVDGSPWACRAALQATKLASIVKVNLLFLTVAKEVALSDELRRYAEAEDIGLATSISLSREADDCLDKALSLARKHGINSAERVVSVGEASSTIVSTARAKRADWIFLGRRPHWKLGDLIKTPVARAVAKATGATLVLVS